MVTGQDKSTTTSTTPPPPPADEPLDEDQLNESLGISRADEAQKDANPMDAVMGAFDPTLFKQFLTFFPLAQ